MLAIVQSPASDVSSVNILPCRIDHTGPSRITKRYWQPHSHNDGSKIAYFRGRRLRGRLVKIPEKYQGLVLKSSDKTISEPLAPTVGFEEDEDDEGPELPVSVKVVEQVSSFDELTVWGHDHLPQSDDALVKGVEEWISFAEAIHDKT